MTQKESNTDKCLPWAAVGNIKNPCFIGPNCGEPKSGTKHFRAGAKIYAISAFWGGCESVTVIGQHRKSRKYMCITMNAKHLKNLRPQVVYSPTIIGLIKEHFKPDRELPSKEDAEELCAALPKWSEKYRPS